MSRVLVTYRPGSIFSPGKVRLLVDKRDDLRRAAEHGRGVNLYKRDDEQPAECRRTMAHRIEMSLGGANGAIRFELIPPPAWWGVSPFVASAFKCEPDFGDVYFPRSCYVEMRSLAADPADVLGALVGLMSRVRGDGRAPVEVVVWGDLDVDPARLVPVARETGAAIVVVAAKKRPGADEVLKVTTGGHRVSDLSWSNCLEIADPSGAIIAGSIANPAGARVWGL